jgi:hypothetical protein
MFSVDKCSKIQLQNDCVTRLLYTLMKCKDREGNSTSQYLQYRFLQCGNIILGLPVRT